MLKFKIPEEVQEMKNRITKTDKMMTNLKKVADYMDTFGCEYLMIDSNLVAHYNWDNGKLHIYNPKDSRKVSRRYETLLFWDNYKNNKVKITDNVMNIQS